jgi:hypothetical protein
MLTISGKSMEWSISSGGEVCSFYNKASCHEYVYLPGYFWKLIYATETNLEIPMFSTGQEYSIEQLIDDQGRDSVILSYRGLKSQDGLLAIDLTFRLVMDDVGLTVTAEIANHAALQVVELYVAAASGVRSLAGDPTSDSLAWPSDLGVRIRNPADSDLTRVLNPYKQPRDYETTREQFHTDLNGLYPGGRSASMQWYDLYNEAEGIYIGSHDVSMQNTCLHVEQDVKTGTLRLGVCRYPFVSQGETWRSEPLVFAAHAGDWHSGSRIYRSWIESTGWQIQENPAWIRHMKGWNRVILKKQYGEINWPYQELPKLYAEARAAGMDTLFLIAWERGGFHHMYPDYVLDEAMGGESEFRRSLAAIHADGGKVVLYISYLMVDRDSDFYKLGGHQWTIKSIDHEEIPFAENYCGEGTWRRVCSPPKPQYHMCTTTAAWQREIKKIIDYSLGLGVDGIMLDCGISYPYFCFDPTHGHQKPCYAHIGKRDNFRDIRRQIKSYGPDKAIMVEHNVDMFAQFMDVAEGAGTNISEDTLHEMYRYTFPEAIMTNRELGKNERNYLNNANFSFIYGLRFDMSVFRCNGTLSDIPNYTRYITGLNRLREQYADYLLVGRFTDNEGFVLDHPAIKAKSYRSSQGKLAVAAWNPLQDSISFQIMTESGTVCAVLAGNSVGVFCS